MKLVLAAIGRLKKGAEAELVARYAERAAASGRGLGIAFEMREAPEGRGDRAAERKAREAESLKAFLPPRAALLALDERGQHVTSAGFAALIGRARDEGGDIALVIGGPDGLDEALRKSASKIIAFGAMTWPHQLVRAMAAEQIYRAMTILSGHPYHRD
jgi:23S rRNA (pseudouridine1915-N3)-methyltransferase